MRVKTKTFETKQYNIRPKPNGFRGKQYSTEPKPNGFRSKQHSASQNQMVLGQNNIALAKTKCLGETI